MSFEKASMRTFGKMCGCSGRWDSQNRQTVRDVTRPSRNRRFDLLVVQHEARDPFENSLVRIGRRYILNDFLARNCDCCWSDELIYVKVSNNISVLQLNEAAGAI